MSTSRGRPPIRLLLDTNIVVSGLLWNGPPRRLLDLVTSTNAVMFYTSAALIEELRRTLAYRKFDKRLSAAGMTVDTLASHYRSLTRVVQPVEARGFVPDDPDDDIVVATAIAAHANLIVSGDDDLLRLEEIANIAVVTAVDALNVVGMWANG